MKTIYKTRAAIAFCACLASVISCVDQEYDLDNINDDMVIKWDNISAPLGSLPAIRIADLIDVESSEYITVSSNGDYSIHFEGGHSETSFDAPTFNMGSSDKDIQIEPVVYSPAAITVVSPTIPIKFKSKIEISDDSVPEEILSVESAKIKATLIPSFSFEGTSNLSKIYLTKGTTLEFPSWVTIGDYNTTLLSKNGTSLTIKEDIAVGSSALDLQCSATELDFTKLPKGQGLVSKGQIFIEDSLLVKGGVFVREKDIINKVSTDSFTATFSFSISEIEVLSAKAAIKPSFDMQFPSVDTKSLSSLFKKGSNLDIYDLNLNLTIGNNTPLSATLNADIDAYKNATKKASVHIGPLEAKANSESRFTLGKRSGVKVENISDLISSLPDELQITNVDIATSENPVEYVAGKKYSVSSDYSIDAPLAFGKDFNIELEHDIMVGLGLNHSSIGSVEMIFTSENSIPLGMSVSAVILDEEGHVIDGSSVNVNGSIEAGSLSSPKSDNLTITIIPGANIDILDSIRLFFKATSDEAHEGESLNMNQCLAIKNVSLKINNITIPL